MLSMYCDTGSLQPGAVCTSLYPYCLLQYTSAMRLLSHYHIWWREHWKHQEGSKWLVLMTRAGTLCTLWTLIIALCSLCWRWGSEFQWLLVAHIVHWVYAYTNPFPKLLCLQNSNVATTVRLRERYVLSLFIPFREDNPFITTEQRISHTLSHHVAVVSRGWSQP